MESDGEESYGSASGPEVWCVVWRPRAWGKWGASDPTRGSSDRWSTVQPKFLWELIYAINATLDNPSLVLLIPDGRLPSPGQSQIEETNRLGWKRPNHLSYQSESAGAILAFRGRGGVFRDLPWRQPVDKMCRVSKYLASHHFCCRLRRSAAGSSPDEGYPYDLLSGRRATAACR